MRNKLNGEQKLFIGDRWRGKTPSRYILDIETILDTVEIQIFASP